MISRIEYLICVEGLGSVPLLVPSSGLAAVCPGPRGVVPPMATALRIYFRPHKPTPYLATCDM